MYVKTTNDVVEIYPYSIGLLRKDNPNTSFPKTPTDELLADWGVFPVTVAADPQYDPRTHKVVADSLPTKINGAWILGKSIVEMTQEEKDAYRAKTVREYELEVQRHMDEKVAERQYDSMISAATYATSTNPKYGPEGQACVVWRDAVWDKCYEVLAEVDAGTRQPPTVDELLAELPTLTWPN
jgi:hypothetical protein